MLQGLIVDGVRKEADVVQAGFVRDVFKSPFDFSFQG
jgi:hypothetical protein